MKPQIDKFVEAKAREESGIHTSQDTYNEPSMVRYTGIRVGAHLLTPLLVEAMESLKYIGYSPTRDRKELVAQRTLQSIKQKLGASE